MFTEQPAYSTKTLYRLPSREQFFQVDVDNEWDFIAEAVVGSSVQPSVQMDQLVLLLESHGIVVHRLPPHSESPSGVAHGIRSPFVTAPASVDSQAQIRVPVTADRKYSFFPRDVALVHGSRVVEAPLPLHVDSDLGKKFTVDNVNALFSRLESAGAEVTRWPSDSRFNDNKGKIPEGKLVEVGGELPTGGYKEEEGPLFCPSDILILSPTLLITRLSSFTNNKGLEYLWSVLSRPSEVIPLAGGNDGSTGGLQSAPRLDKLKPARTTTLLVRITEPDAQTTSPALATTSPRTPTFGKDVSKITPTEYIPLCRALVPINGSVMLYDPALVAEDEARRLKSVLDRVQEDSRLGGPAEGGADTSGIYLGKHTKQDSGFSYGTFGNLNRDRSEDDGWQFISVDGLHSTSILLVSPQLALLSLAPSGSDSSALKSSQDALIKVSQVLESLGVRAVTLPATDLNTLQPSGGVRDAVLVLRRESNLEASDDGNDQGNRGNQQLDEDNPTEGCMEAICASVSAWLCSSSTTNEMSDADGSDRL